MMALVSVKTFSSNVIQYQSFFYDVKSVNLCVALIMRNLLLKVKMLIHLLIHQHALQDVMHQSRNIRHSITFNLSNTPIVHVLWSLFKTDTEKSSVSLMKCIVVVLPPV